MTKQAIDARHVRGKKGAYLGATVRERPVAAGAKLGMFAYPTSYFENYVGIGGLAHDGEAPQISGGIDLGARLQTPTRLAPFVGINAYAGYWERDADNDGRDNDFDGFIDNYGEEETDVAFSATPEVGAHFWITPHLRLTGSAGYQFITGGNEVDSLTYGISLSFLARGMRSPPPPNPATNQSWQFASEPLPEPTYSEEPLFEAPLQRLPPVE